MVSVSSYCLCWHNLENGPAIVYEQSIVSGKVVLAEEFHICLRTLYSFITVHYFSIRLNFLMKVPTFAEGPTSVLCEKILLCNGP